MGNLWRGQIYGGQRSHLHRKCAHFIAACDNSLYPASQALPLNSLWIYTMNRCTLALRGRALLCLDFITPLNAMNALGAA
jgi:hypothetical protein